MSDLTFSAKQTSKKWKGIQWKGRENSGSPGQVVFVSHTIGHFPDVQFGSSLTAA